MAKIVPYPRETAATATPVPPANASAGKRWKFRRNLVIFVAHRNGISQRLLADVFDLPRSSIGEIIKKFEEITPPETHSHAR